MAVSVIPKQSIIQKKTLYNNSARTLTTFTVSDNHADYDVLVFSFKANQETDMFHKVIFWKANAATYIRLSFSTGNNGVDPAYRCDARIWGGSANTIGYTVENYNSENWKVGVVKVVGYKIINVQDLD